MLRALLLRLGQTARSESVQAMAEQLIKVIATQNCSAAVDLGFGIARIALHQDESDAAGSILLLRKQAEELGGTLFVERASSAIKQTVDAFGAVGAAAGLMSAVKAKFDPESVLNPGRFVTGT